MICKTSIFHKALLLSATLLLVLGTVSPAYAQDGDGEGQLPPGWAEIINEDGSINFDNLSDPVQVSEPADWMSFPSPLGDIPVGWPPGNATYLQYTTPSGAVLVVPSPATLLMAYLDPDASGLSSNPPSQMGNGADLMARLLTGVISAEDVASLGYASPEDFFGALANGQIDGNTFTALFTDTSRMFQFLNSLLQMQGDLGNLVNALWLYLPGMDCNLIPGGCPPGGGGGDDPGSSQCPAPTIEQGDFTATVQKTAPNYPLVVGQDEEKRGVDIQVTVSNPPVIFTWHEAVRDGASCEYNARGEGGGCPGPGDQYDSVTESHGDSLSWGSYMEDNRYWSAEPGELHCIEHVEVLPDPIVDLSAYAQLSPASKDWILNDLAEKYYDAFIHQERFDLVPTLAEAAFGCDEGGLCTATALVERVPFADPGKWLIDLQGATAGASFQGVPITQPRSLFLLAPQQVDVYVLLESLVSP